LPEVLVRLCLETPTGEAAVALTGVPDTAAPKLGPPLFLRLRMCCLTASPEQSETLCQPRSLIAAIWSMEGDLPGPNSLPVFSQSKVPPQTV
jgi:hypothetical protein